MVLTEGRPDGTGLQMARALTEINIPVTVILDSGVAYAMDALRFPCHPILTLATHPHLLRVDAFTLSSLCLRFP